MFSIFLYGCAFIGFVIVSIFALICSYIVFQLCGENETVYKKQIVKLKLKRERYLKYIEDIDSKLKTYEALVESFKNKMEDK